MSLSKLERRQFVDQEEESIYGLISRNEPLSDADLRLVRSERPLRTITIRNIRIARIDAVGQVVPYLSEALALVNYSLPPSYERVPKSYFTDAYVSTQDGKYYDTSEQWRGSSFLAFRENSLVGLCIGRQERIGTPLGWNRTERGFIPLIVADPIIRGTHATIMLILLTSKALMERGVTELNGSCAVDNHFADKIYTRFAKRRWVDGKWVRYICDNDKLLALYESMVTKLSIDSSEIDALLS